MEKEKKVLVRMAANMAWSVFSIVRSKAQSDFLVADIGVHWYH